MFEQQQLKDETLQENKTCLTFQCSKVYFGRENRWDLFAQGEKMLLFNFSSASLSTLLIYFACILKLKKGWIITLIDSVYLGHALI